MKNNKIRSIIMFILFCTFIYSTISLINIKKDYDKANTEYSDLSDLFTSDKEVTPTKEPSLIVDQEPTITQNEDKKEEKYQLFKTIDFNGLTSLNSDIIGWILLPGTTIDYPIVHSQDNKEYLKLTFQKEYSSSGSIFVDKNNKNDFSDYNTIIYGHNMKNGTMFKLLKEYKNQEFYSENNYFQIYTLNNSNNYKIISCYHTRYDTDTYQLDFNTKDDYVKWLEKIASQSLYPVEDYDTDKNTITLSTCSGASGSGERWVVHLQKID